MIYNTVTGLSDVKTFTGVTSFRHCVKGNTRFIYLLDDGTNSDIIQVSQHQKGGGGYKAQGMAARVAIAQTS